MGVKNEKVDADLESVERNEKDIIGLKICTHYFQMNFYATFSTDSKSSSNSAFCDTFVEFAKIF
jgi:hypothetical protein